MLFQAITVCAERVLLQADYKSYGMTQIVSHSLCHGTPAIRVRGKESKTKKQELTLFSDAMVRMGHGMKKAPVAQVAMSMFELL